MPRDLAFVHEVGYWSHFDPRSASSNWPLPETASVEELAQYAGTSGALREAPLEGDIFLWWSPSKRRFIRWTSLDGREERQAVIEEALDEVAWRPAA